MTHVVRVVQLVSVTAAALTLAACDVELSPLGDTLSAHPTVTSAPVPTNQVDLLFVIDNSGSMADMQADLVTRFDTLVAELIELGVDVHVGVVTTDARASGQAGMLQRGPGAVPSEQCAAPPAELASQCALLSADAPYLTNEDFASLERAQLAFRCIASVGTCGSTYEMGLDAVRRAVSDEHVQGANRGFLRDGALLAVVVLSDEDDCSTGSSFSPTSPADCVVSETRPLMTRVDDVWADLVAAAGGDASRVLVAAIIGPADASRVDLPTRDEYPALADTFSCSRRSTDGAIQSAADGSRYRELVALAGALGTEESVCADDYTGALQAVGTLIRRAVGVTCLPGSPRPATCDSAQDCPEGVACVNPGDAATGRSYCADFGVRVEYVDQRGLVRTLAGPGSVAETVAASAEFGVNYDATECPEGIAIEYSVGARPPVGSVVRVTYPGVVDVVDDGPGAGDVRDAVEPLQGVTSEP